MERLTFDCLICALFKTLLRRDLLCSMTTIGESIILNDKMGYFEQNAEFYNHFEAQFYV